MSGKLIYFGKVEEGKIILPKRVSKEVKDRFEGHNIRVIFERKRKTRSNVQNNFYWGVTILEIVQAMAELGNDVQIGNKEDGKAVHNFLKREFLPSKDIWGSEGELISLTGSTKEQSTKDFEEYQAEIRKWFSDFFGFELSYPNEQKELKFK